MVLGDRSLIPEELEEAFQRSGITHMLPPISLP
jgi:predicted membrane metal-binding protein